MDPSHISILATAIGSARELGAAILAVRDFNLVGEKAAALNQQLLNAQNALLAHNTAMLQLQQEHFETREQLRKLKEAASERSRYTLVDLGKGNLAYRMNIGPMSGTTLEPCATQAPHYVCQPCLDNGRKAVLQRTYLMGAPGGLECPVCKLYIHD